MRSDEEGVFRAGMHVFGKKCVRFTIGVKMCGWKCGKEAIVGGVSARCVAEMRVSGRV